MKYYLIRILAFIIYINGYSQDVMKDTLFFNENWEITVKEKAKYVRFTSIKNSKYHGLFTDIHIPKLKVVTLGYYESGLINNAYVEKDTNNNYILKGFYEKGIKKGIWTYYYSSGKPKITINYSDNKPNVIEYFNEENESILSNGNGKIIDHIVIGNTNYILIAEFNNGLKDGKWRYIKEDDNIEVLTENYSKGNFIKGKNHSINESTYSPFLNINSLYYSKRLYKTDRYTISNKINPVQISSIKKFYSNISDSFLLLNAQTLPGFPDDIIQAIDIDNYGNIWFATFSKGIFRIKNDIIKRFEIKNYKNMLQYKIHVDNDGEIWASLSSFGNYNKSGLVHIKNDSISILNVKNSGLTCNVINSINSSNDTIIVRAENCINLYDKKNKKWSIHTNPEINYNKYDTTKIESAYRYNIYSKNKSKKSNGIIKHDNKIWDATTKGLDIYFNSISKNKTNPKHYINNGISSIDEFDNGLVISYDHYNYEGITIMKRDTIYDLNTENSIITRNGINKIISAKGKELWMYSSPIPFSIVNNTIIMISGDKMVQYSHDFADRNNYIYDIASDKFGNIYIATHRGIYVNLR